MNTCFRIFIIQKTSYQELTHTPSVGSDPQFEKLNILQFTSVYEII